MNESTVIESSITVDCVQALRDALVSAVTGPDADGWDAARAVSLIEALEELKAASAAVQTVATARFAAVREQELAARNQPADRRRHAIGAQIALARHESPHRGSALVRAADRLVTNLPHTLHALATGVINEYRAGLAVGAASWLSPEDQQALDAELAPQLRGMGDRRVADTARGIAFRLDPDGAVARVRAAVADRRVSIRPAPDTMVWLSALLPVHDGVTAYAALHTHAQACRFAGDTRSKGQIMADELVARLTAAPAGCTDTGAPTATITAHTVPNTHTDATDGNTGAAAPTPPRSPPLSRTGRPARPGASAPPRRHRHRRRHHRTARHRRRHRQRRQRTDDSAVEGGRLGRSLQIMLVMTDRTLLDGDDEPAHLIGYGAIPAALARDLVHAPATIETRIRRLFTDPGSGRLTAMETRSRAFTTAEKDFLLARDRTCRSPWCNAPITQSDHIVAHADGGPTNARTNGRGLCQRCNLNQELADHHSKPSHDAHRATTTTSTGHSYTADAPRPPRGSPWIHAVSPAEIELAHSLINLAKQRAA